MNNKDTAQDLDTKKGFWSYWLYVFACMCAIFGIAGQNGGFDPIRIIKYAFPFSTVAVLVTWPSIVTKRIENKKE